MSKYHTPPAFIVSSLEASDALRDLWRRPGQIVRVPHGNAIREIGPATDEEAIMLIEATIGGVNRE